MKISLPKPILKGTLSVEEAIWRRSSVRSFKDKPLTVEQLSQLLWAAQGFVKGKRRAAPSAGATYPLEIFALIGNISGVEAGVYQYLNLTHEIELKRKGDFRGELSRASLNQTFIQEAPLSIIIAAEYPRTTFRYGERGRRYVHMEIGHVGQNLYLQAESLNLSTVAVGAFHDEEVSKVLNLPLKLEPLYIMPFGYP